MADNDVKEADTDIIDDVAVEEICDTASPPLKCFIFLLIIATVVGLGMRQRGLTSEAKIITALQDSSLGKLIEKKPISDSNIPSVEIDTPDEPIHDVTGDAENNTQTTPPSPSFNEAIIPPALAEIPAIEDIIDDIQTPDITPHDSSTSTEAHSEVSEIIADIHTKPRKKRKSTSAELQALDATVQQQQEAIATLQAELASLKDILAYSQAQASNTKTTMQLYSLFKHDVQRGVSYEASLAALLELDGLDETLLEKLRYFSAYAENGIATQGTLKSSFQEVIRAYYKGTSSAKDNAEESSALGTIGDWAGSLVTIRKVGADHKGDSDNDIIARAEHHILQGDITLALDEIRRLSVEAAPTFKQWRRAATARQEAGDMLDDIETILFAN